MTQWMLEIKLDEDILRYNDSAVFLCLHANKETNKEIVF